jgi:hypothetical protein
MVLKIGLVCDKFSAEAGFANHIGIKWDKLTQEQAEYFLRCLEEFHKGRK